MKEENIRLLFDIIRGLEDNFCNPNKEITYIEKEKHHIGREKMVNFCPYEMAKDLRKIYDSERGNKK